MPQLKTVREIFCVKKSVKAIFKLGRANFQSSDGQPIRTHFRPVNRIDHRIHQIDPALLLCIHSCQDISQLLQMNVHTTKRDAMPVLVDEEKVQPVERKVNGRRSTIYHLLCLDLP